MGLLTVNTFVCLLLILNELIPMYQKKQWRPFWVYTALISFENILVILICAGVRLPSPAVPIKSLVSVIMGY